LQFIELKARRLGLHLGDLARLQRKNFQVHGGWE
jgi:hypothetical protein